MFDIRRIYVTQFFDLYQLHLDEVKTNEYNNNMNIVNI